MDHEEINRIAREAGAGIGTSGRWLISQKELEYIANAIEARAAAKEREECFNVCNRVVAELLEDEVNKDLIELAVRLRDAIRARGATDGT